MRITPRVRIFGYCMHVTAGLSHSAPASYQELVSVLTEQEHAALSEVLTQAEQRKAVTRSLELAQQGGFAFGAPTVPTSFNFGS